MKLFLLYSTGHHGFVQDDRKFSFKAVFRICSSRKMGFSNHAGNKALRSFSINT